ncbi:RHS repeat domain-containing protein [Flavobacteriaceae bacterium 3-367]|uniref:hypothetical protein n=1 Tax=Eudoraea algarum TaxID=3417568 RepID=UPI0032864F98
MKKTILMLLLLGLVNSYGQELPKIIPANPEVASLGKYGDIPVGYHTGVPNISVPLVQLSGRSTQVPVSLSYHASGFRVNEIASRTGLGWTLMAGGSISRSVRGIPDDYVTGFLNPTVTVPGFLAGTPTDKLYWIDGFHDEYDFESDIYHYNFQGQSGKFFFKQDETVVCHPKTDLKIVPEFNGSGKILGFQITNVDGTIYHFGKSKDGLREAKDLSTTYGINGSTLPDPPQSMEDYTTSWKLMDIETHDKELTSFSYTHANVSFYNVGGQRKEIPTLGGTSSNPIGTSYTYNVDKVHRLTSVSNDRGSVAFEYTLSRTDLKFDYALTDVKLKDASNNVVDAYKLNYGYFTSTQLSTVNFGDLDQRRKRLYLQNVQQTVGSTTNKKYTFTYNTSKILPDRMSYAQDFWGYYNGKNNTFFYPEIEWNGGAGSTTYTTIPGGDRTVDETSAKACMLTKITYPTGGYTEFDYESNTIGNIGNIDFFPLIETETEVIDGLSSIGSTATVFEKVITISDPSIYVAGITWSVEFITCANPTGFECPLAELYKWDGSQYVLISNTSGSGISSQGIVFNPSSPLQLKIKLYNNSGVFPPDPRQDISATVFGKTVSSIYDNGVPGGGLRVKSITSYDSDNTQLLKKDYLYTLFSDPTTTSGGALNPPTYVYKNMPYCNDLGATAGPMDLLSSNSVFPLTNGSSYTTCYTNVTELLDGGNEGKNEYTYHFVYDGEGVQTNIYFTGSLEFGINTPLQDFAHRRGLLLKKKTYAKTGATYKLLKETSNSYNAFGENLLDENLVIDHRGCFGGYTPYSNLSERFYQTQQVVKDYHDSEDVTTTTTYNYDPTGYTGRSFPIETVTTDSKGNSVTTRTYFTADKALLTGLTTTASNAIEDLKDQNRVAEPLQVSTTLRNSGSTILSESDLRTNYRNWGSDLVLPEYVQSRKGSSNLNDRIQYHSYYSNGNVREVSKANGPLITYIWGYNEEYPVAKVENASYSQIEALTEFGTNFTLGAGGLSAIQNTDLRTLANAMVTTFTYDPQVGVTSVTDPRGYTTTYEYDSFNRLQYVRDAQGQLLSENKYNYKTQ